MIQYKLEILSTKFEINSKTLNSNVLNVLYFSHLNFNIVSNFVLRISSLYTLLEQCNNRNNHREYNKYAHYFPK